MDRSEWHREASRSAIDRFEHTYLEKPLKRHLGKIDLSAKEARITTRSLAGLLAKHGLDKTDYED